MRSLLAVLGAFTTLILAIAVVPEEADALYRSKEYGSLDLSGRVRANTVFRHQDWNKYDFIMQRNELKLRFEWRWADRGKAFKRYTIPWLKRSDVYLLYRGIYDSIYDYGPGSSERIDFQGDVIQCAPACVSVDAMSDEQRDAVKFENDLREAYIDLYFKHIPLTLRIGKQQIIWGESDGFRLNDRANTLNLSWHFFQELPPPGYGFDEIRIPFWMIKGLWDFRQIGRLSQPFLEFYWNPGDWVPGKISFLPRPWGVKILDPMKNAAGTGALQSSFCSNADGANGAGVCDGLLNGSKLFRQGNYSRNPLENSQFGLRFHFITERGFEWTLNYLYQRFAPDGSPIAFVRGLPADGSTYVDDRGIAFGNTPGFVDNETFCSNVARPPGNVFFPYGQNSLCAEYFAPYIHTIGASLNFFEADYTQTVWRLETVIDFELPFYHGDKQTALFGRPANGPTLIPGITKKNMWKGMLAFDRPTWIRSLNKKTTFFITGQFFWHYIIDHERRRCAIDDNPANGYTADPLAENCGDDTTLLLAGENSGLVGPLDFPKLDAPAGKGRDSIHQWELLTTLAVLGFYRGGSVVPALIYILDPVNHYAQEFAFAVDWFYTPDVALNFTTRLIWSGAPWDAYNGFETGTHFSPWTLDSIHRGRSESALMVTYQF